MEEERADKSHAIVLPFYGQGHLNPMLQFSKRLAAKGLKVTIATMLSITQKIPDRTGSITSEPIYDDCIEGGFQGPGGFKGYLERFEASGKKNLTQLIKKLGDSDCPVKCLVYDANVPWALDIAKQFGLFAAAFFTQSCSAIASYYPMHLDMIGKKDLEPGFSIPALPEIKIPKLESMGSYSGSYPPVIRHILEQFSNIEKADWVLFNSFDKLEEEVVKWMSNLWPVRTIGPTVPSFYLDKRVDKDREYGLHLYKVENKSCLNWLNNRDARSVVYISFGSVAGLNTEQMVEISDALRQTTKNFLWVVRSTEESKLPSNFLEETSAKGLVVSWCPQLEVLAHPAVGCFLTHCGWNSTMEAISLGVPIVAMPQFLDQITNAHYVEQVWGVGVRVKMDEKGIAGKDEIGRCIFEVMDGGGEIKTKAMRWKELAKEAMDEGGSSDKYINEIIAHLAAS